MSSIASQLEQSWSDRLSTDYPSLAKASRQSIIAWLLGANPERLESLTTSQLSLIQQGMEYRYGLLQKRYLQVNSMRAYRNLIQRLAADVVIRSKISSWIAQSRDRQRPVVEVLQEIIQEMLKSDKYLQGQLALIKGLKANPNLKDSLLFASVEEYCLRSIGKKQSLLACRFLNYVHVQSREGLTDVPRQELVKFISDETQTEEGEGGISLVDLQKLDSSQEQEKAAEEHRLRQLVKAEFREYLLEKVGPEAAQWLDLYLEGFPPEAIAQKLNLDVKQIYRLREKINYHAVQVFALKAKPELVAQWLDISLKENNFGLTPSQWQKYWQELTPSQKELIHYLKEGKDLETITKELGAKKTQILKEWSQIYLLAQKFRVESMP